MVLTFNYTPYSLNLDYNDPVLIESVKEELKQIRQNVRFGLNQQS